MTSPSEFKLYLEASQPALEQWGKSVMAKIKEVAEEEGITLQILNFRVKTIDSAVGKLTRKSYTDPKKEMTDLVGARAVCLLTPDLEKLCTLLFRHEDLDIIKSRDTSKEYQDAPDKFGYQSHHFEIRAKFDVDIDGIAIPEGMCCELQVRTLMQHAYAEVVHDSIYKSSWGAPSRAVRFVSSSAALIETADHLFCETMTILESEKVARGAFLERLTDIYDSKVATSKFKDQKFNLIVLDNLQDLLDNEILERLSVFIQERKYIAERINSRSELDPFWSQPVSLLAYFLTYEKSDLLAEKWPFAESYNSIAKIYSDLGKSLYH